MIKKLFILLLVLLLPAASLADTTIPPADRPDFVPLLLQTAIGEIGYKEAPSGYTKYGDWAGEPDAQWCAEFLCWCVYQTDANYGTALFENQYPNYSGTNTGRNWFLSRGRYVARNAFADGWGSQWLWAEGGLLEKNSYIPQPGDWVFFTFTGGEDTDHVAMVENCTRAEDGSVTVHVIEGNNPDSVCRAEYPLDSYKILGYGTVSHVAGTTMRFDCEGPVVMDFEEKLCYLGYLKQEKADGYYGADTIAAVKAFQETMTDKLVSGIADMRTQRELNALYEYTVFRDPDTWRVAEEE